MVLFNKNRWFFISFVFVLFLSVFAALVWMNHITQDIVLFERYYTLLLSITALGIVGLIVVILLNLLHAYQNVKDKVVGSRLTWRMVKIVSAIVIIPSVLFYLFSIDVINRNIDNLHTVEIEKTIQDTIDLSDASMETALFAYKRRTEILADDVFLAQTFKENPVRLIEALRARADAYELTLFTNSGVTIATSSQERFRLLPTPLRQKVQESTVSIRQVDGLGTYIEVVVPIELSGNYRKKNMLLALYPISEKINLLKQRIEEAKNLYQRQDFIKEPLKQTFIINMTLVLFFSLLVALWAVFRTINKLVEPLGDLSQATKEVSHGNYTVKVAKAYDDDFGDLINLFNEMTQRIDSASQQAEKSRHEVASQKVYLETILKYSYGVITLDKNKNIRLINEVCERMLSVDLQQYINTTYQALSGQYPKLTPLVKIINHYFTQNVLEWRQEIKLDIAGEQRIFDCQFAQLLGEGNDLGFVIVLNDISDLNEAQRQAAWGEVARRLAHEIKNPLTPIQLCAERLRKKYLTSMPKKDSEVLDKTTTIIMQQVDSLKSMVSAFSEYAKSPKLNKKSHSLNDIIKQTLTLYAEYPFITTELDAKVPMLALDQGKVQRLLINLIKNSLESTQSEENPTICIITQFKENKVYLKIVDNGEGLNTNTHTNLFEPYVTTKENGTGLGLAIVKRIVEEHQASIKIKNNVPKGCKVTIIFANSGE